MQAQRWQQVTELFESVSALPAVKRLPHLKRAAGDDADLFGMVEAMLTASTAARDRLSRPILPGIPFEEGCLGRFRIIETLGQGGMGQVFLAEQEHPVKRVAAVKVMPPWALDEDSRHRFAFEQKVLASLNHSHIAKLYECGATGRGWPYFAMEYVPGEAVTDYCATRRLDLTERIDLFVAICGAVGHAHLKGVIHRDLKPGNVLVAEENGRAVPKIIDFGIAKSLVEDGEARTGRLALGTYRYMSPEQAGLANTDGGPLDVDTRTDVYSLGVLLYEMLTGTVPLYWPPGTPAARIFNDICQREPPPPSRRWRAMTEADRVLCAAARRCQPRQMTRLLAGELDWITAKALAKSPIDRYQSVTDLAEDLRRFNRHEPVTAAPPGRVYRLTKWARRHRLALAAALLFWLLTLAFTLGLLRQQRQTRAQRDRAETERQNADMALAFLTRMFGATDPFDLEHRDVMADGQVRARDLLDKAASALDHGPGQPPPVRRSLLIALGRAYQSLGVYERADPMLHQALALFPADGTGPEAEYLALLDALGYSARLHGEIATAADYFAAGLALCQERDTAGSLETTLFLQNLGLALRQLGEYDRAESLIRSALAEQCRLLAPDNLEINSTKHNLAGLLRDRGRFAEAECLYREVTGQLRRAMGERTPHLADSLDQHGLLLQGLARYDEAESVLNEALAIRRSVFGNAHIRVADSLNNLGNLYLETGRIQDAEPLCRKALAIQRQVYGPSAPKTLISLNNLANLRTRAGSYEDAATLFRQLYLYQLEVYGHNHVETARTLHNLATLSFHTGDLAEAERLYTEVYRIQFLQLGPRHHHLATLIDNLGQIALARGDAVAAEIHFRDALAMQRGFFGEVHPAVAAAMEHWGEALTRLGDPVRPGILFERARFIRMATQGETHTSLAKNYERTAAFFRKRGRAMDAECLLGDALDLSRTRLGDDHPRVATYLCSLADSMLDRGATAEVKPLIAEAHAICLRRYGQDHWMFAVLAYLTGRCHELDGEADQAEAHYVRAAARLKDVDTGPDGYHAKINTRLAALRSL